MWKAVAQINSNNVAEIQVMDNTCLVSLLKHHLNNCKVRDMLVRGGQYYHRILIRVVYRLGEWGKVKIEWIWGVTDKFYLLDGSAVIFWATWLCLVPVDTRGVAFASWWGEFSLIHGHKFLTQAVCGDHVNFAHAHKWDDSDLPSLLLKKDHSTECTINRKVSAFATRNFG